MSEDYYNVVTCPDCNCVRCECIWGPETNLEDGPDWKARAEQAEAELKHCRESTWIGEKQRSKHIAERVKAEAERDELKAEVERLRSLALLVSQCANGSPAMDNAIEACRKEWKSQTGGGDE